MKQLQGAFQMRIRQKRQPRTRRDGTLEPICNREQRRKDRLLEEA